MNALPARPPACLMVMFDDQRRQHVFSPDVVAEVGRRTTLLHPPMTAEELDARPDLLAKATVLFTSWGAPVLNEERLRAAPCLQSVFHAAGTVRTFMTEAAWTRGLVVSSASAINALPVAEYTLAAILFSLKNGWTYLIEGKLERRPPRRRPCAGAYRSRVGLLSLGAIARQVVALLRHHEVTVCLHDPTIAATEASALGLESVGLLELFATCDVVSVHTPLLETTRGLVGASLLATMKPGATFINTARGALVREDELVTVLRSRPDLTAILDVTEREPLPVDSPLADLPNLLLTPHIAGSMDGECARLAHGMIEELDRWLKGRPLRWQVDPQKRHATA